MALRGWVSAANWRVGICSSPKSFPDAVGEGTAVRRAGAGGDHRWNCPARAAPRRDTWSRSSADIALTCESPSSITILIPGECCRSDGDHWVGNHGVQVGRECGQLSRPHGLHPTPRFGCAPTRARPDTPPRPGRPCVGEFVRGPGRSRSGEAGTCRVTWRGSIRQRPIPAATSCADTVTSSARLRLVRPGRSATHNRCHVDDRRCPRRARKG